MYEAKILADSLNSATKRRLTTFCISFPRYILAEFNTHKQLCLAGDMMLEFELPRSRTKDYTSIVYKMRLDEFVDKWLNGARRYVANPKLDFDLSWVVLEQEYTATEAAAYMGMVNQFSINLACRDGRLKATKKDRTWVFLGKDLIAWRESKPEHTRFDIQSRLRNMKIRQLNESTGDIQWSYVKNVMVSGSKNVYEVIAGDYSVAGSADHRVMTQDGWKAISQLSTDDYLIVRRVGKRDSERLDPLRLKKIDGRWRSTWQNAQRKCLIEEDPVCRRCRKSEGVDIHHLEPVCINPSRAFDVTNITLVCQACHVELHQQRVWEQSGMYLYGALVKVESVLLRGEEQTYDIEIEGEFPNFLANGVVVHNCRNAASSRAIPVLTRIAWIESDPFIPPFGKNQRGMVDAGALDSETHAKAEHIWRMAADDAVKHARALADIDVHKHFANRLIEPFSWVSVITTGTDWSNFFALRTNANAAPEIQEIANMMWGEYSESVPKHLHPGEVHLPLVDEDPFDGTCSEDDWTTWAKFLSAGRCARVSYDKHLDTEPPEKTIARAKSLIDAGHWSPLEHQATAIEEDVYVAQYRSFKMFRKEFPNENISTFNGHHD